MIFAYIRVSSDKQTVENQRDMIEQRGYKIDEWLCDEAVSGTVDWHKRDIEKAVNDGRAGDTIVVAELSRIGRSLKQILEVVEICRQKQITIICIREGIELSDDNPMTKLLISIIGSLAELERNLIAQRTKDALARKVREGVILGRPKGKTTDPKKLKCYQQKDIILGLYRGGVSLVKISEMTGIHRVTISRFIKKYNTEENKSWENPHGKE